MASIPPAGARGEEMGNKSRVGGGFGGALEPVMLGST